MSIHTSRPSKSLADIKTVTGRVDREHLTYRTYFKMGALELEKLRKQKERSAAMHRVANIDERFNQIDNELASLCADLALASQALTEERDKVDLGTRRQQRGLRLKY